MDSLWWALPSRKRFLLELEASLRDGANCLVVAPPSGGDGLAAALSHHAASSGTVPWEEFEAHPQAIQSPTLALCEYFAVPAESDQLINPRFLAEAEAFAGRKIFLLGLDQQWPIWNRFLADYSQACRSRPPQERGLFCCVVANNALDLPRADVALALHYWPAPDRLDLSIYAAYLISDSVAPLLLRLLRSATAAALAGTDLSLAQRFCAAQPEQLFDPWPLLLDYGRDAGWCSASPAAWPDGSCQQIDNAVITHSALLALRGDRREIHRRLWSAQVAVLFPFLEQERWKLISRYENQWQRQLPIRNLHNEEISQCDQLEIGSLAHLAARIEISGIDRQRIYALHELRRNLAHSRPVGAGTFRTAAGDSARPWC